MSGVDALHILGVRVDSYTLDTLLERVTALVGARGHATVAYVNVHVLNTAAGDPALRDFLNAADVCFADGSGVVLGARLLGGSLPGRMTGADWIHDLALHAAGRRWRLAWVAGKPGVTERAARALEAQHPGVRFVFTDHGYHPSQGPEHDDLLARLNASAPDLVLVGMGTPIQERWVAANRARIAAPVVWCVGATADFVSGEVSRGPKVLYDNQEWLARLLVDPRRLWRRFLVGNPLFLARVARQRMTGTRDAGSH
jgi:N-acetylglucosaminyldiphosphoundecaprenol N-acetyl-beta-D-mannosaminyltransferase